MRSHILCAACVAQMEILNGEDRCERCFSFKDQKLPCYKCTAIHSPFLALASVFDYDGPAGTLVKQLKYGKNTFLANSMGAYLAAQAIQLNWPLPDVIVPTPLSAIRYLQRGFNQSEQLALNMGEILKTETVLALGRYSGDYSQAGLLREQRMQLDKKNFVLINAQKMKNKIIYLVDDVLTTGQTLRICGEILQQASPKAIYGMTFCKAK